MNPHPSYCCSPPMGELLVSRAAFGWIQRGEAGIINRKIQLKQPRNSLRNTSTSRLWRIFPRSSTSPHIKVQTFTLTFVSTSCCLKAAHIFAFQQSNTEHLNCACRILGKYKSQLAFLRSAQTQAESLWHDGFQLRILKLTACLV